MIDVFVTVFVLMSLVSISVNAWLKFVQVKSSLKKHDDNHKGRLTKYFTIAIIMSIVIFFLVKYIRSKTNFGEIN
jgi:uncharacterized membrane protein YidH (DUF202 family)